MNRKIRVYVAGPISQGNTEQNVRKAAAAGMQLLKDGRFAPFVPHLSCYYEDTIARVLPCDTKHEEWCAMDKAWIKVSDVLLRLPGLSRGADHEVQLAQKCGIPVYYSVEELLNDPPGLGMPVFDDPSEALGYLKDVEEFHSKDVGEV